MKAWPLKESYLLPDDLFFHPISYVTVSLTLFLLFSLSGRSHRSTYYWLLCYSVYFISTWRASSISKSLTSCSAMPAYASIFVNVFFWISAKVDSAFPVSLLILSPPLLWAASRIPIGSWYCTIWVIYIGGRKNDVWFDEGDEEVNDGCWGFCIVFSCYTWNKWCKLDHCCAWR